MSQFNRPPEAIRDDLLQHVEPEQGFSALPELAWDPEFGFLVDPKVSAGADDVVGVAGFALPYRRKTATPEYDPHAVVYPIDVYGDQPASLQKIKHQSWPMGLRLYSDAVTACDGSTVPAGSGVVGLYRVNLEREKIRDIRATQGGSAKHLARYGLKVLASAIIGTEETVNVINQGYGDSAAVRMRQPLQGQRSMEKAGLKAPDGVEPGILIVRKHMLRVQRIGRIASDNWL